MRYYFDTSAILKRYLDEPGRKMVMELLQTHVGKTIASELALPELSSAFRRAANAKRISIEKANELLVQAQQDFEQLAVARLDSMVLMRATHLAMQQNLRALDSIHLATALEINCSHLVSADLDLLNASKREGLKPVAV